jgi:hypothetical protein
MSQANTPTITVELQPRLDSSPLAESNSNAGLSSTKFDLTTGSAAVSTLRRSNPIALNCSSELGPNPCSGHDIAGPVARAARLDRGPLRWSSWDNSMADVVAHLVSAHELLNGLMESVVDSSEIDLSANMATHSICVALESLDECSDAQWAAQGFQCPEGRGRAKAAWHEILGAI